MVVLGTDRKQIFSYDKVVKQRAWRSLLIVNPKSDAEVNGLLAFCPRLLVTVVWDPDYVIPRAPPSESFRRTAVLARMQVTEGAQPRLRVRVGPLMDAASKLAQEQHNDGLELFSGAVLAQLDLGTPLLPQLRAWAALVERDNGALIGKPIDLSFRQQMNGVKWRPWQNNLWLIDANELSPPRGTPARSDRAGRDEPAPPPAAIVSRETIRTRPVWETLEANLGLRA